MRKFYYSLLFIYFSIISLTAQNLQQSLVNTLQEYHSIPKEVAYLHLNKTLLLQGEDLGFSAYVVNKGNLKPSISTANLYVQVKNSAGIVVKEKLLLVENGVASSTIQIDTTFSSGNYVITAFTNWMRNFEEQNYFTENFRVISSNLDNVSQKEVLADIDVQFLPESGHLLSGVLNTIGVVVKDQSGYGLPYAKVMIKEGGKNINNIDLNRFGIGKFTFIPDPEKNYSAVVLHNGMEIPVAFNIPVDSHGIILSAVQRDKELRLLVTTNDTSLPQMRNRQFYLLVQDRERVEAHELRFKDLESIAVVLDLEYLKSGMNILTLVDEKGQPIAERLFFNYRDLPVIELQEPQILANTDSLQVTFSVKEMDSTYLSVSILPQKTISHNRNHNIVSYILLQPYVRGTIENGSWYFKDITEEKKFELDKLLITQGWSSYNWGNNFNPKEKFPHHFEQGIVLKATIGPRGDRNNMKYIIHATEKSNPMTLDIPSEKEAFVIDSFKPINGEQLSISRITKNDKLLPAGLSLQFFPSAIPDFRPTSKILLQKPLDEGKVNPRLRTVRPFEEPAEILQEVLIKATVDKVKERERKLQHPIFGKVNVITNDDVAMLGTLAGYLRSKGLAVSEDGGMFKIGRIMPDDFPVAGSGSGGNSEASPRAHWKHAPNDGQPQIIFDGMRMVDYTMFYQYPLSSIDYIEFGGLRGAIEIHSLKKSRYPSLDRTRIQKFDIPLAYSREKEFYVPKYENENDSFFENYGVIDWKPVLSGGDGENMTFKIKKPEVDFQMIIEGFSGDGTLIYDVKKISAKR